MSDVEVVTFEWHHKVRTLELHRLELPDGHPSHAMGASVGEIQICRVERRDGTFFWTAALGDWPAQLDPGDGYEHTVSCMGDSLLEVLNAMEVALVDIRHWASWAQQQLLEI